jgi:crotonobetainyl-CoA:carnitine CoA-transferase CaiB-like acyl-CoA transferase
MIDDPRFCTIEARKKNEEELDKIISEWTQNFLAEDVQDMMQEAGMPRGCSKQVRTNWKMIRRTNTERLTRTRPPYLGKHHAVASPYIMSKTPCEIVRGPLLGEHNEYIFKEVLGMTDDEITDLIISGAME